MGAGGGDGDLFDLRLLVLKLKPTETPPSLSLSKLAVPKLPSLPALIFLDLSDLLSNAVANVFPGPIQAGQRNITNNYHHALNTYYIMKVKPELYISTN